MIFRIFEIVFPLIAIGVTGWLYGRLRRPDMSVANHLNTTVFLPALIFHVLAARSSGLDAYALLALAGALVVLGSGALAWPVARAFRIEARTFVPPMMFNNCGNMGLPLAVFAFGEQALTGAVVLLIVSNLLQFTAGIYLLNPRAGLVPALTAPSTIATVAGLAVGGLELNIPALVMTPIEMLGRVSIPLMLFALGVRLTDFRLRDWQVGIIGAATRPLTGLIVVVLLVAALPLAPLQRDLLILFAVLPPAVLNFVLAEIYQQEPDKVASIVMTGNVAAIIIIPAALAFVLA